MRNLSLFGVLLALALAPAARAQDQGVQRIVRQAMAAIGDAVFQAGAVRTGGVQHDYVLGNAERAEGPWRVLYVRFNELRPTGVSRLRRVESPLTAANAPDRVTVLTDSVMAMMIAGNTIAGFPANYDDLLSQVASAPDVALRLAAASSAAKLETPVVRFGVTHDVIALPWANRRMRIEVSRESHFPTAVEITGVYANDPRRAAFGDVRVRADHVDWRPDPNGSWWPRQSIYSLEGERFREVSLNTVAFEPAAPAADSFAVSDSARSLYRANLATSPARFTFGARGAPEDLRDGIVRLKDFWTMTAVKQPDGILLFEAHLSGAYLGEVVDYLAKRYPGVPVKGIVMTSDPWAHVGGVREAVARGIPIYLNERSVPFVRRLLARPHQSSPDRLAKSPRAPKLVPIKTKVSVGTGTNRIDIYPVGGAYGERMLMVHFPEQRLLYGADLVFKERSGPGYFAAGALDLHAAVKREGLAVDTLFCVQASPLIPWSEFVPAVKSAP